jgi:hypothetical protein
MGLGPFVREAVQALLANSAITATAPAENDGVKGLPQFPLAIARELSRSVEVSGVNIPTGSGPLPASAGIRNGFGISRSTLYRTILKPAA